MSKKAGISPLLWRCCLVSVVLHTLIWIDVPSWINWVSRLFDTHTVPAQVALVKQSQSTLVPVSLIIDAESFDGKLTKHTQITAPIFKRKLATLAKQQPIRSPVVADSVNESDQATILATTTTALDSEVNLDPMLVASMAAKTEEFIQHTSAANELQNNEPTESDSAIGLGRSDNALIAPSNTQIKYRFIGSAKGLIYRVGGDLIFEQSQQGRYQLSLDADSLLGGFYNVSSGQVTAQGLVPDRYHTTTRRGFSSQQQAINFQRDKQLLTAKRFEASLAEHMDAQDVLSVSVQLGMLLLYTIKRNDVHFPIKFTMHVANTSGFTRWMIACDRYDRVGADLLVHCARLQQKGDEKRMEIWFSPEQQGFPARVSIDQNNGDWIEQVGVKYDFVWDETYIRNERK